MSFRDQFDDKCNEIVNGATRLGIKVAKWGTSQRRNSILLCSALDESLRYNARLCNFIKMLQEESRVMNNLLKQHEEMAERLEIVQSDGTTLETTTEEPKIERR